MQSDQKKLARLINLNSQKQSLQNVKQEAHSLAINPNQTEFTRELYSLVYMSLIVQEQLIDELIKTYKTALLISQN